MSDLAQRLRSAALRCARVNADVALLCERALDAAMAMDRMNKRSVSYVCPQCNWTLLERADATPETSEKSREYHAEITQQLRGENNTLAGILRDALAVIETIEPENDDEAERLYSLRAAMVHAVDPYKRDGTLL